MSTTILTRKLTGFGLFFHYQDPARRLLSLTGLNDVEKVTVYAPGPEIVLERVVDSPELDLSPFFPDVSHLPLEFIFKFKDEEARWYPETTTPVVNYITV